MRHLAREEQQSPRKEDKKHRSDGKNSNSKQQRPKSQKRKPLVQSKRGENQEEDYALNSSSSLTENSRIKRSSSSSISKYKQTPTVPSNFSTNNTKYRSKSKRRVEKESLNRTLINNSKSSSNEDEDQSRSVSQSSQSSYTSSCTSCYSEEGSRGRSRSSSGESCSTRTSYSSCTGESTLSSTSPILMQDTLRKRDSSTHTKTVKKLV